MAFSLVWTKRATQGYDRIISYLDQNWTVKEVQNFVKESDEFFALLCSYPEMLQKTNKEKNLHRGPLNRLTIITYRVKFSKQEIEIINIRGARQKPLK